MRHMQQAPLHILEDVILTSAVTMQGVKDLKELLRTTLTNKELFPNMARSVPTTWMKLVASVKKHSAHLKLDWSTYRDLALSCKFPDDDQDMKLKEATRYFHSIGLLLYLEDILPDSVFLNPSRLMNILKLTIRHDISKLLVKPNSIKRNIKKLVQVFQTSGIMHAKLLPLFLSIRVAELNAFLNQNLAASPLRVVREQELKALKQLQTEHVSNIFEITH